MDIADDKEPLLISSQKSVTAPTGWGYRHLVAFMAFLGFFNVYCLRVNLSVALVTMVNSTEAKNDSNECPSDDMGNSTNKVGEFPDWDKNLQGQILGSFFYGYICTQIPGGWLAEKFGGKLLFGLGVLGTAVLTLVTPVAARLSVGTFLAVRVLEGLGEGVTFPAMHAMWGKWGPLYERSKLAGFSYAGAQLGTVFALPISGLLCDSGFLGGWPSVFYIFGALACLWFIAWMFLVYRTPADDPRISKQEEEYIESTVGCKEAIATPWKSILMCPAEWAIYAAHTANNWGFYTILTCDIATPWKSILMCPAVWAICAAHTANNWGFYTMLTCLPSYLKNVLKFDIKTNGFLSALPYLGCYIGQLSSGIFADYLRSNGILSTLATRRILTTFALVAPGVLMMCVQFAGCNHIAVVSMLTMALLCGGITMGGFQVNHIDLSPNFAGVLMGMSNTFATIPGFLGPEIVGILTEKNDTRAQWSIVFYIAAGVYFSGALIYLIFAKGVEQPWNNPEKGLSFSHKEGRPRQVQYRERNTLSSSGMDSGVDS